MCRILEQEREEGKIEGKIEGKAEIIALIRKKMLKGQSVQEIADILELEENYIEKIITLLKNNDKLNDIKIASLLLK